MASVSELVPVVGVTAACEAIGVARASFYRQGYVNLQVLQEVSTATAETQFGAPIISTREASQLLVPPASSPAVKMKFQRAFSAAPVAEARAR